MLRKELPEMSHPVYEPSHCFLELTPDKQCHVFLCNDLNTSNPRIFNKWQCEFESKDDFGRGNKNNNSLLKTLLQWKNWIIEYILQS